MFHVSIRPSDKVIVRNHYQNLKWASEERDGPCVRANESFEIIITAEREFYKLTVDGQHLGTFRHRLPLHLVQFIKVSGKVLIDYVLIEQDMSLYHHQQPQMSISQFSSTIPSQNHAMSANQYAYPSAPPVQHLMVRLKFYKKIKNNYLILELELPSKCSKKTILTMPQKFLIKCQ